MVKPRPRRCAKGRGCREWQPCPKHPQNWNNNTSEPLPADWKARKRAVGQRDGFLCRHCGTVQALELDHIIPRSKGGTHHLGNLQLLCASCHRKKTADQRRRSR